MPGALLNFAMLPSNCIMRMTELCMQAMATQLAAIPRGRNRAMRILVLDILPPDLRTFPAEKATPAESAERGTRRWVPWRRRLLGPPLVVQIDRWWSVAVGAAIAAANQVHRALPRHVCLPPGPLHPKAAPVAHDVLRQGRRVAAWAKLASAKITDPRSIGEAIFFEAAGSFFCRLPLPCIVLSTRGCEHLRPVLYNIKCRAQSIPCGAHSSSLQSKNCVELDEHGCSYRRKAHLLTSAQATAGTSSNCHNGGVGGGSRIHGE